MIRGIGYGLLKLSLLVALTAVMCKCLVNYLLFLGINKRVYNHVPGACSAVAGLEYGSVDIELLASGNVIFTSGLRLFNKTISDKLVSGSIHSYNISSKTAWELPINSKTITKDNLNPHGIGFLFDTKTGNSFLFLINHRKKMDSVEVFRVNEKNQDQPTLIHVKTVKSPLFKNLRDVVPVSKERFYVTSYYYFDNPTWQTVEDYFGTNLGSVLYFDGKNSTYAQRWIPSPTGIALDKSKKYLYVSSIAQEAIFVYKITDVGLIKFSEIPLGTSPYNLWMDPLTADLYVGCQPIKMKHFRHETAPHDIYSPSQVLKLHGRPAGSRGWRLSEVFANDGATLSGSSAALKTRGHLLVGTVHDKLLVCELEAPHLL